MLHPIDSEESAHGGLVVEAVGLTAITDELKLAKGRNHESGIVYVSTMLNGEVSAPP